MYYNTVVNFPLIGKSNAAAGIGNAPSAKKDCCGYGTKGTFIISKTILKHLVLNFCHVKYYIVKIKI